MTDHSKPTFWSALCGLTAAAILAGGWALFMKPDPDVERGNKLIRKGKAKEALSAYQKAEKRLGRRERLDYNRGLALFGVGKFKEARKAFESAFGATDAQLRRAALFNLANTSYKLAEAELKPFEAAGGAIQSVERKLKELGQADKKTRCAAYKVGLEAYKKAMEAADKLRTAFDTPKQEYRRVLMSQPKRYEAKWNLELVLRHRANARSHRLAWEKKQQALQARFDKECEPPKKKNQKKQNQKNKNQNKQNQNKQNQNKQNQNKQNQNKQNQNKQNQNKQNQNKQNQNKQNQNKQNQNQKDPQQKPLTKEDIRRRKAARKLDQLERQQRKRDRNNARHRMSRSPVKDW